MKNILRGMASFLIVGILSVGLAAQTTSARYDGDIQTRVTQQLSKKQEFRNLQASTEDGIVTLSGTSTSRNLTRPRKSARWTRCRAFAT